MTAHLTRKLEGFGTTIFAEMSALAVATGSINLGQGFPDTDGPPEVLEAAIEAIRAGRGNQYPPGPGVPELRSAIADHQRAYYGIELDPDRQVLVTCGATEAIASSMLSLLDDGDECILFEPFYDSYPACVQMAGAKVVPVTLRAPDFQPDPDALRAAVTPRTRMIVVNSPHNPTGAVFSRASLEAIAAVAREHDLLVLSDEAYEHLTFDGTAHVPISTLPDMAERTVTVGSAGKTLSFTGWKVGWATGPADLVGAVRTSKQFLTYVSSGPFQYAVAVGLRLPPAWFSAFAADLQARRDRLAAGLAAAGFGVVRPSGTYFITTDISGLTDDDGASFCRALPARAGVVAIPNSVFYARPEEGRSYVRFAFCKRFDVIDAAVERLARMKGSPA
jgi:N-succinyldiaminopimelate aminotransferase